jgi:S-DNA-T family DNA segregation ATPase FtsK/SpoIIIE
MAKKEKTKNSKELIGSILLITAILVLLSFININGKNLIGPFGELLSRLFYLLIGKVAFVVPFILGFYGINILRGEDKYNDLKTFTGILILVFSLSIFIMLLFPKNDVFSLPRVNTFYAKEFKKFWDTIPKELRIMDKYDFYLGGVTGFYITNILISWVNIIGAFIINFVVLMVAIILIGKEKIIIDLWKFIAEIIVKLAKKTVKFFNVIFIAIGKILVELKSKLFERKKQVKVIKVEKKENKIEKQDLESIKEEQDEDDEPKPVKKEKINIITSEKKSETRTPVLNAITKGDYVLPSTSLLKESESISGAAINYTQEAERLKKTLNDFGIECEVVNIIDGPVIARYEIELATGVKVSNVENLAADIALAMKVEHVRIAPVPDKALLGIEVPKSSRKTIYLRELIEDEQFQNSKSVLTIAIGKDISGNSIIAELTKMPHLLIAGATGSGKSVCINSIITSLLFKATPDEVKFLLVDPKRVELTNFRDIPHLLAPVITDAKIAALALKKLIDEMDKRYEILAEEGAQNIEMYNKIVDEYNQEIKNDKDAKEEDLKKNMPYIVLVIDELADLMLLSKGSVEESLRRLAQLARAVGIHLILATQRPSVDVITGVIKANFPTRIAFQVISQVDSRTILDTKGAETLLGRGDMLFAPSDANKPIRGQAAFVSVQEIAKVAQFIKHQRKPEFHPDFDIKEDDVFSGFSESGGEDSDILEQAIKLTKERGEISTSYLQRKLGIGYSKAARLIDEMEARGLVTAPDGNKPRKYIGK